MVTSRNRKRPELSLAERLLRFAEEAREAARLIVPSREQEILLAKARKAESIASAVDGWRGVRAARRRAGGDIPSGLAAPAGTRQQTRPVLTR
jgi:hypothetical protein